jgi:hypothetical protein
MTLFKHGETRLEGMDGRAMIVFRNLRTCGELYETIRNQSYSAIRTRTKVFSYAGESGATTTRKPPELA